MPLLLPAILIAGIGGAWWFSSSAGTAAGNGIGDAATIVGIAVGVGIIIYAVHVTGKTK